MADQTVTIPIAEAQRVASILHAIAKAANSNHQQLHRQHARRAMLAARHFANMCAMSRGGFVLDEGNLNEVMHRFWDDGDYRDARPLDASAWLED